ncbi:amidohydrolase family protein [Pseudomonas aeruginosa]|uniref:amidohydrolase family protein n=1 Tax=Pseudomonas aeruginosa TaxID=287 RepID=UPI00374812E0|nr:amidohydrolase [Pseudomonas aeruginosa]HBP6060967.1 amidohydrolase [Pseudomonas aeruginosa]HBP6170157.1 amidohydrolase [Pseudomonas aeruginosa]HBP6483592.1 amidohydrolase [Pseudomonas aeruginosa]
MSNRKRIDVHQHIVPQFWADALPSHGGDPSGWKCPDWSCESALAFMDSLEIEAAVLSLTAPGVKGWNGKAKREISRKVNEYTADVVARYPTRFGNFATLPLPDVEGALEEIGYAFDTLNVDGVVLLSNYNGVYLGDPSFDPIWTELDRRKAVVFIHPTMPQLATLPGLPGPMLDYPFDTTRTAAHLLQNGVISRYSGVRIILSHAGGFLPYAAYRVAAVSALARNNPSAQSGLIDQLRTFYFDTALSSPSALPSLLEFAKPENILFGSDFPYAPAPVSASFTAQQDDCALLSEDQHRMVNRTNALPLFPRLESLSERK